MTTLKIPSKDTENMPKIQWKVHVYKGINLIIMKFNPMCSGILGVFCENKTMSPGQLILPSGDQPSPTQPMAHTVTSPPCCSTLGSLGSCGSQQKCQGIRNVFLGSPTWLSEALQGSQVECELCLFYQILITCFYCLTSFSITFSAPSQTLPGTK